MRPTVPETYSLKDWPRKVASALNYLLRRDAMRGVGKDEANSSTTLLGAGASFTGDWVVNDDPQIAVNALADQPGTLFLEFALDAAGSAIVLSKSYQIFANSPQFDALVKMPSRYHRVRFVNGATPQTQFNLLTSTGDGLFPFAPSDRDTPKFAASNGANISAEQYRILVDLSDRTQYPHHFTGHVNLHSVFFFVDKSANTVGQVQMGVITRIDGTNADIVFAQGVSFNSTSDRSFARDRIFIDPISLGISGGNVTGIASGFKVLNVALVNTATPLPTQFGTATPAVGDLVVRYDYTSGGSYNAAASVQYTTSSAQS